MKFIILLLSIMIFVKTLSYGIYEYKSKNKYGGVFVIISSVLSLVLPYVAITIRGE